ncbi:MAG: hypothetical protein ACYSWU_06340, partial [Planctomycetota bacterium]
MSDSAYAVAIQPDGKIVAAGPASSATTGMDFALVRYNVDGSLDDGGPNDTTPGDSFGNQGIVTTDLTGGDDNVLAVRIQSDGKIVVAGFANYGIFQGDFGVARYNADGTLDDGGPNDSTPGDSFGDQGIKIIDFDGGPDLAFDIALQGDGYLVAGYSWSGTDFDVALTRLLANGQVDTTFGDVGDQGKVTTDFGSSHDIGLDMAIAADGKIVVGGHTTLPGTFDFALVRYLSDGKRDSSFGNDGKVAGPDFAGASDYGYGVAIQPEDQKILLAGSADMGTETDFGLARYLASGQLDPAFDGDGDSDGKITTDFLGGDDMAGGLAVSPDGKIVAAGVAHNGTNYDFALARYLPDGERDSGFGSDGKVMTPIPGTDADNRGRDCALDADNKIVLAGFGPYPPGSDSDFIVARYLPGPPDIAITGFAVNQTDSTLLDVSYHVWNSQPGAFDIGLYASVDGIDPGTLLMTQRIDDPTDLALGSHSVTITPDFTDVEYEYWLMARLDANSQVEEGDESNNNLLFEGGIFQALDGTVYVYGSSGVDPVDISLDAVNDEFDVTLNGQPAVSYATAGVSAFHVRTYEDDDTMTVGTDVAVSLLAFSGDGADDIYGGADDDVLYGGPGSDWLRGQGGDDSLYGGDGIDNILGAEGDDLIEGEVGDDILEGQAGDDLIYGGLGSDQIDGGLGNDSIHGGEDNDYLYGRDGDDYIEGGPGHDYIYGGNDDDTIDTGLGLDFAHG